MNASDTCDQAQADRVGDRDLVFYDGHCGLCHRSIKWLLRQDPGGKLFVFAPLQGPTFEEKVPAEQRAGLPDSVIVQKPDGQLLVHSTAAFYLMDRLGGLRGGLGRLGLWIPRPLRDLGYRMVAASRHKIFDKPKEACPMMPPELRDRFLP